MTCHDHDWESVMADIAHDEARERRLDPAESPEWNQPQTPDEDRQRREWVAQYQLAERLARKTVDSRASKR